MAEYIYTIKNNLTERLSQPSRANYYSSYEFKRMDSTYGVFQRVHLNSNIGRSEYEIESGFSSINEKLLQLGLASHDYFGFHLILTDTENVTYVRLAMDEIIHTHKDDNHYHKGFIFPNGRKEVEDKLDVYLNQYNSAKQKSSDLDNKIRSANSVEYGLHNINRSSTTIEEWFLTTQEYNPSFVPVLKTYNRKEMDNLTEGLRDTVVSMRKTLLENDLHIKTVQDEASNYLDSFRTSF